MSNKIRIGSRGSDLALWQANFVQSALVNAGFDVEIIIIKTQGDKIQHLSFDKMEGKGFFTKEIEDALIREEIDLAVHSHKDLETTNPPGLVIAAVPDRADVRDLLLINKASVDQAKNLDLSLNAVVGTSSARRKAQILHLRPDVTLKDLRGNVPTRIQKLREGQYDAILLAKAGVDRLELDLSEFHCIPLDPKVFVPAPAQGALGLQIRENDELTRKAVQVIHNEQVSKAINAERQILRHIEGGCQVPLGVYSEKTGDSYTLKAAYAKSWDSEVVHFEESGTDPEKLAEHITNKILGNA